MHTVDVRRKLVLAGVAALAALASVGTAQAGLTVLYAFTGGNDGRYPEAGVILDKAGNLYGTTTLGGGRGRRHTECWYELGCGTVFKLAPDGAETVLHAFAGGHDGGWISGGVIRDKAGNLFGTTAGGGAHSDGTVFKVAPDGSETVLYSFAGASNGNWPSGGVIRDQSGNLYGTTQQGGKNCEVMGHPIGCGTVFKIAPDGSETVLYAFAGGSDGAHPEAGVIEDQASNLYGATYGGGDENCYQDQSCGTVFKLAPDGTETLLHVFRGVKHGDGVHPEGGLIDDTAGNLYGTTMYGGSHNYGTIFKLAPDGTETVLYAFAGGRDGAYPEAGLIRDKAGNLYGTTYQGGANDCYLGQGCGTVFKLAPNGSEAILYAFRTREDVYAANPAAGLVRDKAGNFYGTTEQGGIGCDGYGCGTVFRLTK